MGRGEMTGFVRGHDMMERSHSLGGGGVVTSMLSPLTRRWTVIEVNTANEYHCIYKNKWKWKCSK